MKNIIVTVFLVMAAFAAVAQTNLPFLTSKAALRAYAVQQAQTATMQLWSQSTVGQPVGARMIIPSNHTSADIIKFFTISSASLKVLNPKDQVYLDENVLNADGDSLFYGYGSSLPFLGKGSLYDLPAISAVLRLQSWIPVKFSKQVSSAEMLYVDPITGQTYNNQQLYAYGNNVYYPSDSAGGGFLKVNYPDGSQDIFDLKNGGIKVSGIALTQKIASASIEGLLSFTNPIQTGVIDTIPSNLGIGQNRTYEVIMAGPVTTTNYITVSITTSEGYRPLGIWVIAPGTVKPVYYQQGPSLPYVPIPVGGGVFYMVPEWDPAQFREPDPYIYNGGGKD